MKGRVGTSWQELRRRLEVGRAAAAAAAVAAEASSKMRRGVWECQSLITVRVGQLLLKACKGWTDRSALRHRRRQPVGLRHCKSLARTNPSTLQDTGA